MKPPQALQTTYPARLATYSTALLGPTAGAQSSVPERRTKRGTAAINYAEIDMDDDVQSNVDSTPLAGGSQSNGALPSRITAPVTAIPKPPNPKPTIYRTDHVLNGAASLPTVLIPIRIDLDLPQGRLHDTFLWNLHETLITPQTFAMIMCADLDLPQHTIGTIASAIRDQVAEYAPVAQISLPESAGEMRAICSLEVNLDDVVYGDKFEWDLTNTLVPPEKFAKGVAADLGLRSEFIPSVAAGLYEFALLRKKDLYDSGLPELDNGAARGSEGGDAGWRLDQETLGAEWEPRVELLSREEIEKREIDREREVRRLRRETARFGNGGGTVIEGEDLLGRGGRGRIRKRQRSASPTPVDGEWDRRGWACRWCLLPGHSAWGAGDGPDGPKTLCFNCSTLWKEQGLPEWAKSLHAGR